MPGRVLSTLLVVIVVASSGKYSLAATFESPNFQIEASTAEIAKQVGESAELTRRALALKWFGKELGPWTSRCRIQVRTDAEQPGGMTSLNFHQQRATDIRVFVDGPVDQILESVLPHELTHVVLASYFGRALPRWVDEGAALLSEADTSQLRQRLLAREMIEKRKQLPLRSFLGRSEYPRSQQQSLAVYLMGFSLADFLVNQDHDHGRTKLITFLKDAERTSWDRAVKEHYHFDSIELLEKRWHHWALENTPIVATTNDAPAYAPAIAQNEAVALPAD